MNDADIIVALGDVSGLAERLGLPRSTVANWKARGIPWHMRPIVQNTAKRFRVNLPDKFLMEKKPVGKPA